MTEREKSEWQRMLGYLHQQLRAHPKLTDVPGRVFGSGHLKAVWGTYAHGPIDLQVEAAGDRWREPFTRARADQLVEQIATELQAQYDALPKRKNG